MSASTSYATMVVSIAMLFSMATSSFGQSSSSNDRMRARDSYIEFSSGTSFTIGDKSTAPATESRASHGRLERRHAPDVQSPYVPTAKMPAATMPQTTMPQATMPQATTIPPASVRAAASTGLPQTAHPPVSSRRIVEEAEMEIRTPSKLTDLDRVLDSTAAARRDAVNQLGMTSVEIESLASDLDSGMRDSFPLSPFGTGVPGALSRVESRLDDLQRLIENVPEQLANSEESEINAELEINAAIENIEIETPDLVLPPTFSSLTENVVAPQSPDELEENDEVLDIVAVTEAPVDRMSLANNLYGAEEFELALQSYRELSALPKLPARDKLWVRYQIGNCQQRLGDQSESQRSLRQVAAAGQKSRWGQHAHWWLETNDRTHRLMAQVEAVQSQITETQGEENESKQP